MAVDPVSRIAFMLRAIEHAQSRIADVSVDKFGDDYTLVVATLFDLAVVGKAARLLPREFTAKYPTIPWSELAGLWDIAENHCMNFEINPLRVWNTIEYDLSPLVPHLQAIDIDLTLRTTMLEGSMDG